nr:hypothetical protein BaRGS_013399 [Batillaria attramentaria]
MRTIMKRLPYHQRRQLARQLQNGNSMLFSCCQMGHVEMVNYLLEDCGADIEQRGVYEVSEDGTRHQVSPLWCAAVADHVEVVESLLKHGANINQPSDTGSTPVRSACFMTNIEVVKKLVEAGADIHKPNVNGGTCLINSVQSTDLCLYLIRHGARVNDKDNSGNLALHYAIREGRLDTVKLLIQHGSDYNAKNDYNDNALQTAALRGHDNIVEYLIECGRPKLVEVIHAYELLGATYIDERRDIAGAIALWKKAMTLRYMDPKAPILKTVAREKLAAYNYRVEATTKEELEKMVCDPDNLYMEVLLLRERILGSYHKDTSFGVMFRGAIYADNHDFQRCIDLWKYAYRLRYTVAEDTLGHELVFTVVALVKLFWEMQLELTEEDRAAQTVCFDDVLDTLEMLLAHIQHAQRVLWGQIKLSSKAHSMSQSISNVCSCGTHSSGPHETFIMLMQLVLNLIHLMAVKLEPDSGQKHLFYCMVYQLVKLDPRTREGESLLHLAFSLCQLDFTSEVGLSPPQVVEVLLECGADVDAVTINGETPLRYCLKPSTDAARRKTGTGGEKEEYLKILLKYGAHVDRVDKRGRSCLSQLEKLPTFCPLQHTTLQCLAARVICKHKDKLRVAAGEVLSAPLAAFVKMHG